MKKKAYEQPKMEVVEIDHADIICTSDISTQAEFEEWEEINL